MKCFRPTHPRKQGSWAEGLFHFTSSFKLVLFLLYVKETVTYWNQRNIGYHRNIGPNLIDVWTYSKFHKIFSTQSDENKPQIPGGAVLDWPEKEAEGVEI